MRWLLVVLLLLTGCAGKGVPNITVQCGPWTPDLANVTFQTQFQPGPVTVPCADCLNVYYSDGCYRSTPTPVNVIAIFGPELGGFTMIDPSGVPRQYFGIGASLYFIKTSGSVLQQMVTGLSATQWSFAQFGSSGFAVDGSVTAADAMYTWGIAADMASAPTTAVSSAPVGNVIATVAQFLMVGDIGQRFSGGTAYTIGTGNGVATTFSGTIPNAPLRGLTVTPYNVSTTSGADNGNGAFSYAAYTGTINYATGAISVTFSSPPSNGNLITAAYTQAFPNRVQWSAIGNPTSWPTPLTNAAIAAQSGYEDLESDLGPVMFIAGYPLYAVIFQRTGITRATYVGGNVVFQFGTFERKHGLVARKAAVQVGAQVFFLSDSGFMMTDGANTVPIGTAEDNSAGIDKWFWSTVNTSALNAISAAYDGSTRCVYFAIPTGANTAPDTLLAYNILSGRWTKTAMNSTLIWTDSDGTRSRLGVLSQVSGGNYYYQLLTGTPNSGYLETCDLSFTDGNSRLTTAIRPNSNDSGTPTVQVGNRNTLSASVSYSVAASADAFGGGFAPVFGQGLYTRARVTTANAAAVHGATLVMQSGGPV